MQVLASNKRKLNSEPRIGDAIAIEPSAGDCSGHIVLYFMKIRNHGLRGSTINEEAGVTSESYVRTALS